VASAAPSRRAPAGGAAGDPAPAGFRVFIDFDNTITLGDVLDGIIERFAADDRWRSLEEAWAAGTIGARACLEGQMLALRAGWPELARHLAQVRLDPGFAALRDLLRRERIELTVVSDNFDLFVGHILRQHGLADVAYRANHLEITGDRLRPSFPFANPACPECAHCKKIHFLPPHRDRRRVVFIGDGRSDLCPARHADIVFAKDRLLAYLQAAGIPCRAYRDLGGVVAALEKSIHEIET
jgi:2-hydroxy-3-keto-5-methylthiopentenyl-1-phosphate phosphatase